MLDLSNINKLAYQNLQEKAKLLQSETAVDNLNNFFNRDIQRIVLYFLIFMVFFIFIKWIIRNRKRNSNRLSIENTMPANIWFYSKLLDFELGLIKLTALNLESYFYTYLKKKYKITEHQLKIKTIFVLVNEREDNSNIIELFGDIYNKIKDLKTQGLDELVLYIKEIKTYFNQDDLSVWLESRKTDDCNDC